jgi:hypothetical protein
MLREVQQEPVFVIYGSGLIIPMGKMPGAMTLITECTVSSM